MGHAPLATAHRTKNIDAAVWRHDQTTDLKGLKMANIERDSKNNTYCALCKST